MPVKIGNVAILCQWELEMYQYSASGNWKCINIVPVDIGNVSILCQWKLEMYQYSASGNQGDLPEWRAHQTLLNSV